MPDLNPRPASWLLVATIVLPLALAGCFRESGAESAAAPPTLVTRDIRLWVEPMTWTVHPNVATDAWAFCAEGNGVEPVHADRDGGCGVPGPTIRVNEGDRVRVTFENTHVLAHSLEVHGEHPYEADMNGNAMFGHFMMVHPGETKTIEWIAGPAGTFIYHCHVDTPHHMAMGMYGVFIVEDPGEERPEREFVAVLDEWQVREEPRFVGNFPDYNYFTINGRSFPLTAPWAVKQGERFWVHLVNAGDEMHSFNVHGYTFRSWEGVAGPAYGVPTDVAIVAPGQSVVLDVVADREGLWLAHDHILPRVTAAADGNGIGVYGRGILTILAVGEERQAELASMMPKLLAEAEKDAAPKAAPATAGGGPTVRMAKLRFDAGELRVRPGGVVSWTNEDAFPHTVTSEDGSFDSGDVPVGGSWSRTFDAPGRFAYYCRPHSYSDGPGKAHEGMVGVVVVEDASAGG